MYCLIQQAMKLSFDLILADNKSGSAAIIEQFLELLERDPEDIRQKVVKLKNKFSEMAIVQSICNIIENQLDENRLDLSAVKRLFYESKKALIKNAVSILSRYNSFVTISSSSDVYDSLSMIAESKKIRVLLSISEPAKEGIFQAKRMANCGIDVTLTVDAAMAYLTKDYEAVVVGADAVGDSSFVNKIGSFSLILAANYYNKPAYIIANMLKKSSKLFVNEKDPMEVGYDSANIHYKNFYFEEVPLLAQWIHQ